jgi:hypothetical protein
MLGNIIEIKHIGEYQPRQIAFRDRFEYLPPEKGVEPPTLSRTVRREKVSDKLYRHMVVKQFQAGDSGQFLPDGHFAHRMRP